MEAPITTSFTEAQPRALASTHCRSHQAGAAGPAGELARARTRRAGWRRAGRQTLSPPASPRPRNRQAKVPQAAGPVVWGPGPDTRLRTALPGRMAPHESRPASGPSPAKGDSGSGTSATTGQPAPTRLCSDPGHRPLRGHRVLRRHRPLRGHRQDHPCEATYR